MPRSSRLSLGLACLAAGLLAQVSSDQQNPIWQEYGLQQVSQSTAGSAAVTIYRLKDPTGAFAAAQWQRAQRPESQVSQVGNYVLCWSAPPTAAQQDQVTSQLNRVDRSALPALPSYLPARGRVAQSERYSLGEASLRQFEPRLPAAAVGFDKGAEVELAAFSQKAGPPASVALILYPTPQIARQQVTELEKVPELVVRRKSSLVSVVLGTDERSANRVLDEVRYEPIVVWNEKVPKKEQNPGVVLLEIFALAGILIAAATVMGFVFGGFRWFRGRGRGDIQPEPMILLHLGDK